jgi:hypothetical protein
MKVLKLKSLPVYAGEPWIQLFYLSGRMIARVSHRKALISAKDKSYVNNDSLIVIDSYESNDSSLFLG